MLQSSLFEAPMDDERQLIEASHETLGSEAVRFVHEQPELTAKLLCVDGIARIRRRPFRRIEFIRRMSQIGDRHDKQLVEAVEWTLRSALCDMEEDQRRGVADILLDYEAIPPGFQDFSSSEAEMVHSNTDGLPFLTLVQQHMPAVVSRANVV